MVEIFLFRFIITTLDMFNLSLYILVVNDIDLCMYNLIIGDRCDYVLSVHEPNCP